MAPVIPTFKCILMGDKGTGKTAFVKRLLTGEFTVKYEPTVAVLQTTLQFFTDRGCFNFTVSEIPDKLEKMDEYRENHFQGAQCAIVLFDTTCRQSYKNVSAWHFEFSNECGTTPFVIVGNKTDAVAQCQVPKRDITYHKQFNLQYYGVSVKRNDNIAQPFRWLISHLIGDKQVKIVPMLAVFPSLKPMTDKEVAAQKMAEAEKVPLPEEEDDVW